MPAGNDSTHGRKQRRKLPITFSATAVTQLLASFASFLGAFVLPLNYPELGEMTRTILLVAGFVTLFLGLVNLLFGHLINKLFLRVGLRSRVVIPREGMVYLAIMLMLAIGALLGHQNTLLLVFGLMAGPFVLNGWIVYFMLKGLSPERVAPRHCMAGETITVDITLQNRKRLLASRLVEVRDFISGQVLRKARQDHSATVTFVRVPGQSSRTGRYQLSFRRRGLYRLGPMRASSRFPLGIGERGQTFSSYSEILVRPELGVLTPSWTRKHRELMESANTTASRTGVFDDEFHCIREYRDNDNPRAIHWRSTARHGELMVREFEQNRQSDVFVILDLCFDNNENQSACELAISLAATLCVEQTKSASGGRYAMAVCGKENHVMTSRVAGLFREATLDTLASCDSSAKVDLQAGVADLIDTGMTSGSRGVLITPRPEFAMLLLPQVAGTRWSDNGDSLLSDMVVIEATEEGIQQYMTIDGMSDKRAIEKTTQHDRLYDRPAVGGLS